MKRSLIVLTVLLMVAMVWGCGYRTPEACQEAIFKAISNDDAEAFFKCVLSPPEDEKEREAVFTWARENYTPYLGGEIMSKNEVDNVIILNVAPSADYLSIYGSALAPEPLGLAFVKENGYKLDLEYTEKIKELQELYKGLMR
ncbi:MAG: hypothetical protein L0213_02685 [Candidatus Dadabacteria bacterium]|nr:hypothetical protein [Candidatus Dadabacteria bacterium]